MKKLIMLLMIMLLVGCQKSEFFELDYDNISYISLEANYRSERFKNDKTWQKIFKDFNALEFEKSPSEDVTDFIFADNTMQINATVDDRGFTIYIQNNKLVTNLSGEGYHVSNDKDVRKIYDKLREFELSEDIIMDEKPVIYLYPEETMAVEVHIETAHEMTTSYPIYHDGWYVTVEPSGKITSDEKEYAYLYWEGIGLNTSTLDSGFLVEKAEVIVFLEEKLTLLGLNYREQNDFITYWLPRLEAHDYNHIKFLTEEYDELATLHVTPEPDTTIRVFMIFEGLDQPRTISEQQLSKSSREGFTVVEWGGGEIGKEMNKQ